jgi:hypothetical protein
VLFTQTSFLFSYSYTSICYFLLAFLLAGCDQYRELRKSRCKLLKFLVKHKKLTISLTQMISFPFRSIAFDSTYSTQICVSLCNCQHQSLIVYKSISTWYLYLYSSTNVRYLYSQAVYLYSYLTTMDLFTSMAQCNLIQCYI